MPSIRLTLKCEILSGIKLINVQVYVYQAAASSTEMAITKAQKEAGGETIMAIIRLSFYRQCTYVFK